MTPSLPQRREGEALASLLKLAAGAWHPPRSERPLEHYLYERYVVDAAAWKRRAFYALKPLIPRRVQLLLRRQYVAAQSKQTFPAWPIEPILVELVAGAVGEALSANGQSPLLGIAPWPAEARFAFCVTHDVEWDAGLRRAPAVLEVERRVGVVSSWNLVPERYPIDWGIVAALRNAGAEVGIHGLKHDGRLFNSRRIFRDRLQRIEEYAREWGAVGFRSPSCLRNAEWMRAMAFEYDCSFPDTDPYEPQPGGCCSPWPYFLGSMVELPLTMPQDHTVYEILGHADLEIWNSKANWLEQVGGLVLINVHPDYMTSEGRLGQYEEFLRRMMARPRMWHALPKDVAQWWRQRDASSLDLGAEGAVISGPAATRGWVARLEVGEGGVVQFSPGSGASSNRH